MRTLVLADTHGGYKALLDVFKKSGFDYNEDKLICLGDVADGWPDVVECFDELMKVKNLVYIIGNHDYWLLQWLKYGEAPNIWTSQGGRATILSFDKYNIEPMTVKSDKYTEFLEKAKYYYKDNQNRVFVHGGFNRFHPVELESEKNLMWDRDLLEEARCISESSDRKKITEYKEVYIGHTATQMYASFEPLNFCNVWALDTGAGWSGKLTIMDVDTKEYKQSDFVKNYYPEIRGR